MKRLVSVKICLLQTFLKYCVALLEHYLWCNFQQDWIIFRAVRAQKIPKMAQFMDAPSPQKLFKIYDLRTTYATNMKLTTIVYFHGTFHLTKDLGVTHRVWEGVVQKPLKKSQQMVFWLLFLEFSGLYQKP